MDDEVEIKEVTDFEEMKNILENEANLFYNYLTAYNIRVFDRTITRAEDY
ncbi:MAG: hypothetical protein KAX31_00900 [Thermoplasmata archaeon]|nr:hypothetical protein [Thermoplasmata archaeon]